MPVQTDLWEIAAASLHTDAYRSAYADAIAKCIKDTRATVLDTACGSGFPTLDLCERGYTRLTCVDGDRVSVRRLRTLFQEKGLAIPVINAVWQELDRATDDVFDVVLNVDNSLVYLDGWLNETTRDPKEAFARIERVLRNFYSRLRAGGTVIIGSCDTYPETVTERTYLEKELTYKGKTVSTVWRTRYDWPHRLRSWTVHIKVDGEEAFQTVESYIVTKEEMAGLLEKAGFVDVRTIDIRGEEVYDWLFVGKKR